MIKLVDSSSEASKNFRKRYTMRWIFMTCRERRKAEYLARAQRFREEAGSLDILVRKVRYFSTSSIFYHLYTVESYRAGVS
eukprot:24848_6